jgi:hypothetical protein
MKIKLSEIRELIEKERLINSTPFDEIEFIDDNGEPLKISETSSYKWMYTGLTNIDFITTGYYLLTDSELNDEY